MFWYSELEFDLPLVPTSSAWHGTLTQTYGLFFFYIYMLSIVAVGLWCVFLLYLPAQNCGCGLIVKLKHDKLHTPGLQICCELHDGLQNLCQLCTFQIRKLWQTTKCNYYLENHRHSSKLDMFATSFITYHFLGNKFMWFFYHVIVKMSFYKGNRYVWRDLHMFFPTFLKLFIYFCFCILFMH